MLNEQLETELVNVTPAAASAVQELMTKQRSHRLRSEDIYFWWWMLWLPVWTGS